MPQDLILDGGGTPVPLAIKDEEDSVCLEGCSTCVYILSHPHPGVTWIQITDTGKPPAISDSERKTGEENCLPSEGGAGLEPLSP